MKLRIQKSVYRRQNEKPEPLSRLATFRFFLSHRKWHFKNILKYHLVCHSVLHPDNLPAMYLTF